MSEARFSLKFDGPAVENGEIDVQDFAPALLAVGDLFQAANAAINGEQATASVRVRATAEGSFEVDFAVVQQVIDSIFTYAESREDGIAAANDLADFILKVGGVAIATAGTTGGGLLLLLKWLRGRKPEAKDEKGGDVTLQIGDTYFVTNKQTIQLAEDLNVRQQARKLVSILEREGIESISSMQADGEELRIERADVSAFDIPEIEEEELEDEVRARTLQIVSLSFKEDNKWRLTDGAEPFSATIEDVDFLNRIANSEISFAKDDYLECEVRERQVRTATGLRKERTIIRVIKHTPAPRQTSLI